MESKKYNKVVNITKKQQPERYREQTSAYQWGGGKGQYRGGGVGGTNYWTNYLSRLKDLLYNTGTIANIL